MGGERSSTTRMRLTGRICYACKIPLPAPETRGEQLCPSCRRKNAPSRRVHMTFMYREDWHCRFLEADCKTSLPRTLTFKNASKIIELALRGGYGKSLEDRQALERAIETGRGGIWLNLTDEQYTRLSKP